MSDDDAHHFHLEGERRPLFGDARDLAGVRDLVLTNAANEVALTGRLRSAFVYVLDGNQEHMPVDKAEDLGKETILAGLFRNLAQRNGVLRAFRQGERRVEVDGRGRRAAAVLELDMATGGWWLASRLFGTGEASVGVFHGEWEEREGAALDELDEPFREWLDAGTSTIEIKGQAVEPGPGEDIRCATIPWPAVPPDPPGVGVQLAQAFFPEFLAKPLDCLIVFALRPGSLERWELRGKLSLTVDDLARGIAAQGPTEAMALLTPSVIELGGVTRRCLRMLVERAGRLGQLVMPLEIRDGKIVGGGELKYRDEGPVPAGGQWIGVAPEREVNLNVVGPVDAGEVPEG